MPSMQKLYKSFQRKVKPMKLDAMLSSSPPGSPAPETHRAEPGKDTALAEQNW
ncbi:hypothetical protein GLOTRDRAFT_134423 [Gloeophyllum trabeum ATCC 11539]|uniref:Uncharacterized protein n=1 Tax=Gloeophyllum trabeum (strain ATCC 11539 / FP-39264 / Madison 617) TaxID=670483 RepID=S7R6E1_GLOTA|nr:uncharacterized protein GLOTRDRAFT_134423 [Gloeophyllum trabeum ATCC 11539]EPQ49940.1 hypothetical protein GLOTRDRAFT_134423 [Gloeophyllum trabeum ATCC 11539]